MSGAGAGSGVHATSVVTRRFSAYRQPVVLQHGLDRGPMDATQMRNAARCARRRALIVAGLVALAPMAAGAAYADGSPGAEKFVPGLADQAIALSRKVAGNPAAHTAELTALLDRSTYVALVGRLVLGRQWRSMDEAQRREYQGMFRDYVLAGLVRRLGGVEGIERVDVTGSRLAQGEDSMVGTRIKLGRGAQPANVEWRVRQAGDSYKIIDVVVEGVSLVVSNRNQFGSIVNQRGVDGLLDQLREWRALPAQQRPAA